MFKKKTFLLSLITLLLPLATLPAEEAQPTIEAIDKSALSESLGHLIVRHLTSPGFEFDVEKIIQGIRDEKEGKPSPMSEEDYTKALSQIQETLFLQMAEKNLGDASAFLEKNCSEEGIVSVDPKLQYRIEKQGEGEEVVADATPLIHYTGKLLDGTVFSSSYDGGEPLPLPIQQTIAGFSRGLVGMKEGEKRTLFIHPELAYGVGGHLPPNSLLIFEVEVLKADSAKDEQIASQ